MANDTGRQIRRSDGGSGKTMFRSSIGGIERAVRPTLGTLLLMTGAFRLYLDNASTTRKPQGVIDALPRYCSEYNANVHRGVHLLSERATAAYEGARAKVQQLLNAGDPARSFSFEARLRQSTSLLRPMAEFICKPAARS